MLLRSVVGFSSGISTMGDTCGVANGGVAVLGKKYAGLPSERFYLLCAEYFRRLEAKVGTPNCGIVHGGKHLARNFRRAILTGKTIKLDKTPQRRTKRRLAAKRWGLCMGCL